MSKKNTFSKSRRAFVKKSALATAGFFIVPSHVLGGNKVAPSDTLYIAGIGAGGKGASDLEEFSKSPHVKIVAYCDVDERQIGYTKECFPKASYYKDFRKMLDKEKDVIDACSISTPDHTHAVATLYAMQLGKHVYTQKPLTHDIYEARVLQEAEKKYKVVTQMGNQGSSGNGVRKLKELYGSGLIGEAETVHVWTNRPVWVQGLGIPSKKDEIPEKLDWDLWLGPNQFQEYHKEFLPFNWRGFWDFGTGALGDMGCHLIDAVYEALDLDFSTEVECSVGNIYEQMWTPAYYPESCPIASSLKIKFQTKSGKPVNLHWSDGGITPFRPEELGPDEPMGDGGGGIIIEGTKGKIMSNTYGEDPRLLPLSLNETVNIPETLPRVPEGHYLQWVHACMAGYGKAKLSSSFEKAGPITEGVLMGNLALRAWQVKEDGKFTGRKKLLWDSKNMKVTNYDPANAFVKRAYREGWKFE